MSRESMNMLGVISGITLLVAGMAARCGAITIQIDYTFDRPNGFFSVQQRRDAVEGAAHFLEQLLTDNLSAIVPSEGNRWIARFPSLSSNGWSFAPNLTVPADTLIVYAAGRDLLGKLRGKGGPGTADVAGDAEWVQTVNNRGQLNASGPGATDFGPWGGSVTFDTATPEGTRRDWNFGFDTDSPASQDDFFSVALHELGHVLGLGTSDSWDTWVDPDSHTFIGPETMAQFGGPVELDTTVSAPNVHWKQQTTSTVYPSGEPQIAVMVPKIADWRGFTVLDVAALEDVGWETVATTPALQAGDANEDYSFDSLDIILVSQAGKYLTGEPATWGEGDWDGAPGGYPGNPPPGNGLFDQIDIIAALNNSYLTGPYAAISPGGVRGDAQTSIVYDARSGSVAIDAPAGKEVTSINIDSAAGIFSGEPVQGLGGSFDNDADDNIFRATFGCSFGCIGDWRLGNVAMPGLPEEFILNDLTVVGSLAGGGDLGDVDLIYIPEPSSLLLALIGIVGLLHWQRWRYFRGGSRVRGLVLGYVVPSND